MVLNVKKKQDIEHFCKQQMITALLRSRFGKTIFGGKIASLWYGLESLVRPDVGSEKYCGW